MAPVPDTHMVHPIDAEKFDIKAAASEIVARLFPVRLPALV